MKPIIFFNRLLDLIERIDDNKEVKMELLQLAKEHLVFLHSVPSM